MIQVVLALVVYAAFCGAAFWVDPFAGAVFVLLGLVAVACVTYLVHVNRKLCAASRHIN